jgi:DNA polymerase-3 subunit epsilon
MTVVFPFVSPQRLARWRADRDFPAVARCAACVAQPAVIAPALQSDHHDSLAAALASSNDFRVLRRLEPRSRYDDPRGAPTHSALYVDVETTGLDHANDRIIQLAVVPFTFTSDGRVCEVAPSESWYEDPGVPIDPAITRLTGIRDADVVGQRIDDARVAALLQGAALVIAHNARFDRPFLEGRLAGFMEKPWACSMADVPWLDEGLPTSKLEWLAERHCSVFYDAHRADIDCRVGVHLLASALPSGRRAMEALLGAVRAKTVRVWALESAFATKELLKERGYRWSNGEDESPKAWYRDVSEDALRGEVEWLKGHVYKRGDCPAVWQRIGARTRYSNRVAALPVHPANLPLPASRS